MKQYLLFAGTVEFINRKPIKADHGWKSFWKSYETLEQAKETIENIKLGGGSFWFHIVDLQLGEIIHED